MTTTGRRLIHAALRQPMTAAGWTPRQAGWFTIPVPSAVVGGATGSVVAATAVEHYAAGAAGVNWIAGFRDEALEQEVTALVGGVQAGSRPDYVERTVITTVSPDMDGRGTSRWTVDAGSVAPVAADMAGTAHHLVVPWLQQMAEDRLVLAAVAYRSRRIGPRNLARAVLLARDADDAERTRHLLQEAAETAVGDNPAHAAMREAVTLLSSAAATWPARPTAQENAPAP